MPHTLLLLKRQISAKLLALGVYLRSGYPILSARIIPLVMQLILGQPRTASHGLGLSVAWIGPPPSVDGSINCIEQSHFLPLFIPYSSSRASGLWSMK